MKDSIKIRVIAGMWGAAFGTGVYYVQTVINERKKRKAIDNWKEIEIENIRKSREEMLAKQGYLPGEVLLNPQSDALKEELSHFDIEVIDDKHVNLRLKTEETEN
jgi:hypothetical protein